MSERVAVVRNLAQSPSPTQPFTSSAARRLPSTGEWSTMMRMLPLSRRVHDMTSLCADRGCA